MIIQHNISAMNANRNHRKNAGALSKNLEKLSSGYRINRAGDDAAGLSISEKMRAKISGMDQAGNNVDDGISLIYTVEGALQEVHAMLDRIETLSTQASTGTLDDVQDRAALQKELDALKAEINRIGSETKFNNIPLFRSAGAPIVVATCNVTVDLTTGGVIAGSVTIPDESAGSLDSVPEGYKLLAEKIANEYLPNAVKQILDAFPSLSGIIGSNTIDMTLEIGNIDGKNNTLAYAQVSCYSTGEPIKMLIKVDTSDFSDESIGTNNMLESTIAHELMHTVMQYAMTDEMVGRNNTPSFPTWFKEGTAQLVGGGFPTGWNSALIGKTDADQIANYLNDYTASDRPYGHGYLASAFLGYMANGGGSVTAAGIAAGMDAIFEEIAQGSTLYEAVNTLLGTSLNSIADLTSYVDGLFTNAAAGSDITLFVKDLVAATGSGAGSITANGGLSAGSNDVIGNATGLNTPFQVKSFAGTGSLASAGSITLQIGTTADDSSKLVLELFELSTQSLGLENCDLTTAENAKNTITAAENAINAISTIRGYYGANQNRLEHTGKNLGVTSENLSASESRIRDADMAEEFTAYTKNQILLQSAQSMLAQSNQVPQGVLTLLR